MAAQARRRLRERRPLTRDAIVDAALTLLDRDGLAGLSMRKLADELGVGAASLYWHVGDKEELLGLLLDRIVGETQLVEPDPGNWQEQVKEMGREVAPAAPAPPRRRADLTRADPGRAALDAGARALPRRARRGRGCRSA